MAVTTNFPPTKILYVPSKRGVAGSEEAFNKLESKLTTFKKRKFYGLNWGIPPNEKYWACVKLTDKDNPKSMGCKVGMIPGGKYAKKRVYNWEKNLSSIGDVFKELIDANQVDVKRPFIEYYQGMGYMVAMVPVLE